MLSRVAHPQLCFGTGPGNRISFRRLQLSTRRPLNRGLHDVVRRKPELNRSGTTDADLGPVSLRPPIQKEQKQWNKHEGKLQTSLSTLAGGAVLPVTCPGCGALSQQVNTAEAGFYTRSRKTVRAFLKPAGAEQKHSSASATDTNLDHDGDAAEPVPSYANDETTPSTVNNVVVVPLCDRCHELRHNYRGVPIAHPSLQNIADSIAESPFTRNHVYHVLDAADFPMSLEPRIFSYLSLARARSQNRRSQSHYPYKPTLSFIITRSDLLAPTKDKVDGLMPYFQSILRTALGRAGEKMRLGNVHLVSAKRGWWTTDIKQDIWKRGGGNWMVGKFNVGKSNLFEVLFPKGSGERAPVYAELARQHESPQRTTASKILTESSLLPPAQPESAFPTLPLVSNLPGTTASPIRLPFGNNKGELIDLPGLGRGNLTEYVHADHKLDLVMTTRPKVLRYTMKPGQSMLLGGGLIRITPLLDPNDPSTTMIAYPFVPVEAHVTSTEKAIGEQAQTRESGITSILAVGVGDKFASAGIIKLGTDVTKHHAGSLLRAGVPIERLPFRVYSTDLLIEGVGWVEIVCQVRRRRQEPGTHFSSPMPSDDRVLDDTDIDTKTEDESLQFKPYASSITSHTPSLSASQFPPNSSLLGTSGSPESDSTDTPITYPSVEIFTPEGKHISSRPSLNAYTLWKEGNPKLKRMANSTRPRRSMKGAKKREKIRKRATAASGG